MPFPSFWSCSNFFPNSLAGFAFPGGGFRHDHQLSAAFCRRRVSLGLLFRSRNSLATFRILNPGPRAFIGIVGDLAPPVVYIPPVQFPRAFSNCPLAFFFTVARFSLSFSRSYANRASFRAAPLCRVSRRLDIRGSLQHFLIGRDVARPPALRSFDFSHPCASYNDPSSVGAQRRAVGNALFPTSSKRDRSLDPLFRKFPQISGALVSLVRSTCYRTDHSFEPEARTGPPHALD